MATRDFFDILIMHIKGLILISMNDYVDPTVSLLVFRILPRMASSTLSMMILRMPVWVQDYFPFVFADHGITLTPEQIKQYSNEKKEIYMKILEDNEILPVPGVKEFLKKVTEGGYQICIASGNKPEAIDYLLERVGVRNFFDIIVTNKDAAKSKPAPDIFLAAAAKLGLSPSECVVFEDAVNGAAASESAGIRCIGLATRIPEKDLRAAGADYVVQSYDELMR